MYPSSTSSSSQGSMGPSGENLMRCGSAPSSLLTNAVDSVGAATRDFSAALGPQTTHHLAPTLFFPTQASESTAQNDTVSRSREEHGRSNSALRPFGFPAGPSSSPSLVRHSSSPAGFLNQLATAAGDNGFSITRGIGGYNSKGVGESSRGPGVARLNSQLSFTRQEGLSRIAEETESETAAAAADNNADHHHHHHHHGQRKSSHSYANGGFTMGSWDDGNTANPSIFSVAPSKRSKSITGGVGGPDAMESQFQFSIPQGAFEMATMEKLLHIPQDSVPCKIRAKRGCATHPRSIAERERRTRISGKLKKLQDLVPNMDKQTSYADMLDLAVQHIKGLQNQVQKLNKELESCTCGCKKSAAEHK